MPESATDLIEISPGNYVQRGSGIVTFPAPTVIPFGDSVTENNFFPTSGAIKGYTVRGYLSWANILLRHRLQVIRNAGITGNWTADMLARLQTDVIAYQPGWCIVNGGGNDIVNGVAASTVIANLGTIVSRLRAAGIAVVLTTITPRTGFNNNTMKTSITTVNSWIRNYCWNNADVILCDWMSVLSDPSTGDPASGMMYDGTHPSTDGAGRMGTLLANAMSPYVPAVDLLPSSPNQLVTIGGKSLLANPFMVGTGGTGGIADSWSTTGGGVFTPSKVARTDFYPGAWNQFVCTSGLVNIFQQNTNVGVDWNVGDLVYAICEFETDASGWVPTGTTNNFGITLTFVSNVDFTFDLRGAAETYTFRPASGVLMTPVIAIPATTTAVSFSLKYTGAGTFRMGRTAVMKVSSGQVV